MAIETIKGKITLTAKDLNLKEDHELLVHIENYINHQMAMDIYIKHGVLIRVHLKGD